MSKKLCELCGLSPAAVPDRNRMGRPIKRICLSCHADRLEGDVNIILTEHALRQLAAEHGR